MTGYGGAKGLSGKIEISAELKSVNNRYLDCSVKIPRMYISFEEALKSTVGKYISKLPTTKIQRSHTDNTPTPTPHLICVYQCAAGW